MFKSVAAFELRYQLKSPAFWVTFAIFLLLTFAATASDNVQIGSGGNVWKNSPYAIAQTLMVMSVFSIFILTAFVANVVVRDDETGFGPIIHSTRLSRFDYLFGRFTGAFLAGCLLFLSAPLGMIIGAAMPWLDPEMLGPFNLVALRLRLPAALRADAVRHRRRLLRDRDRHALDDVDLRRRHRVPGALPRRDELPVAARVHRHASRWSIRSASARTTRPPATGPPPSATRRLPDFAGYVLWNRVLWVGIAFALLGAGLGDLFARREGRPHGRRPRRRQRPDDVHRRAPPRTARDTGRAGEAVPAMPAGASSGRSPRFDMAAAIRSPAFIVLLGIGFVNSLGLALVRRRDLRQHDPSRHAGDDRERCRARSRSFR